MGGARRPDGSNPILKPLPVNKRGQPWKHAWVVTLKLDGLQQYHWAKWSVHEGNPAIHVWGCVCRPRVVSMTPLGEAASAWGDQLYNHVALSPQKKRNEER